MSNYQGYEIADGGVLQRVAGICRHLTSGGSFTDASPVPLGDVERFIDDAYYRVMGELARHGYNIAQTDTQVLGVLQNIQALDAVAQIEFSVPVTAEGEENTRYKGMIKRRDDMIASFIKTDVLQQLGATRDRNKSEYLELTGRSVARKQDVYTDSDVVRSRFPRGFGRRPDLPERSGTDTAGGADPDLS